MTPNDPPSETAPEEAPVDRPAARIRRVFSGSKELLRIVYRDPVHVAERLTLYAVHRLGDGAREWVETARTTRPDMPLEGLAEELRVNSAQVARIDGAISGTPFFIALIPGYLTYLWEEARMTLRIAALYGRDLNELRTAAEMLALRQVHPTVEAAEAALTAVLESPVPDRPTHRRSLRTWVNSGYRLLVFGGFMSPSTAAPVKGVAGYLKTAYGVIVGGALWVMTWVFPVTFMVMMAWGCETHARQLGRRALVFYDSEEASIRAAIAASKRRHDHGHSKRELIRGFLLFLSVVIPIVFIAYVNHVRKTTGINYLSAIGALVAVSLVIGTIVISGRR